jgi:hypothetical protein
MTYEYMLWYVSIWYGGLSQAVIRKVRCSNLGRDTDYPDYGSSGFPSFTSVERLDSNLGHGRAIAEAVSLWLPTAAARVQSQVWSSGICGGQSGVKAGFLRVLRFPLPFIPPISPSSQSPGAGTISQWVADVPSGPSLDSTLPTMQIKKKKLGHDRFFTRPF